MRYIKTFESLGIPNKVRISKDDVEEMMSFLTDNEDYIGVDLLNELQMIVYKLPNGKESNVITNWVEIPREYISEYKEIKLLVEEAEFIEDCLIELKDNKMVIKINAQTKIITIRFNTIEDNKLMLDVLDRNKRRFTYSLNTIDHKFTNDSRGVHTKMFVFKINYECI